MCFGGGSQRRSQRAAERAERERQAQISGNVADIEQAFTGRGAQREDFAEALREQFRTDLAQQKEEIDRQARFSLARGGLTGGSAARDVGSLLRTEFEEGVLGAERTTQGRLADLVSADEQSRLRLISLAQSGPDVGNAAQQTASALRSNIEGARATGLSEGLGDVFGGAADLFRRQEEAAQRRRGLRESELFTDPFSRGT